MSQLRTIISGLGFAEAPRWHRGQLWFVDYFAGTVNHTDLAGAVETVARVEGAPGGLGFLPDGTPLVVSQREFRIYRIGGGGELELHADLSEHCAGAANEMIVDEQGRAWVGHHGFDFFGGAELKPSTLLRVDPNGSISKVAEDLIFPNGMAILPDRRTFIVAESFANRLTAFDLAPDGGLSNRRTWAELGDHTPDGICADSEGAVWAGSPMTGAFVRVREGGEIAEQIETLDKRWAVACAFVGDDLRTLACITAATTLEDMPQGKSEAFVELADVDVAGAAA